jgi:broad specificity phosphatase PhoE
VKNIIFIRHSESIANAGGVTMAHDAIPLSELGKAQAQALATVLDLQPGRIVVSEYVRTYQTALPFCNKVSMQPVIHSALNEFSCLDPALIQGMVGEQRRPMAEAYWQTADPDQRIGEQADTFHEFEQRVTAFIPELDSLPDKTVLFGHGIWFALLTWKLLGFNARHHQGMKAFRRFRSGFPMPNAAVYRLESFAPGRWRVQADEATLSKVSEAMPAILF